MTPLILSGIHRTLNLVLSEENFPREKIGTNYLTEFSAPNESGYRIESRPESILANLGSALDCWVVHNTC